MSKFPRVAVLIGSLVMGNGPLWAQSALVQATCGSVSIGRDVSGSTVAVGGVVCGIPPETLEELIRDKTRDLLDLSATQRELIQRLRQDLDLNQRQIRMALEIVGEAQAPPERLSAKLVEVAERFKALSVGAATQPGDDPRVRALKADAQTAVEEGDLVKADQLLAEAEAAQVSVIDRLALNAAETAAQRGRVALTRLHYMEAAQHFATAAARVPNHHDDKRLGYLKQEASALFQQGDERGDIDAAQAAILRYNRLSSIISSKNAPLDWAENENLHGVALSSLGSKKSDVTELEKAAICFENSISKTSDGKQPSLWTTSKQNLGVTFFQIGSKNGDVNTLKKSVAILQDVLESGKLSPDSSEWLGAHINLAISLTRVGVMEVNVNILETSASMLRDALSKTTREQQAFTWARAQHALGSNLSAAGTYSGDARHFESAVSAFRAALQVYGEKRTPMKWASSQNGLGGALSSLGKDKKDVGLLLESLEAYNSAKKYHTRDNSPHYWAVININTASVLYEISSFKDNYSKKQTLEEALSHAHAAAELLKPMSDDFYHRTAVSLSREISVEIENIRVTE
ncbi:hypothetical protein [Methylorubrum extorquens]